MNSIPIDSPRPSVWKISVPHLIGVFRQDYPFEFPLALLVEETQLHLAGAR
jgi:hypothetical protein